MQLQEHYTNRLASLVLFDTAFHRLCVLIIQQRNYVDQADRFEKQLSRYQSSSVPVIYNHNVWSWVLTNSLLRVQITKSTCLLSAASNGCPALSDGAGSGWTLSVSTS